MLEVKFYDSVDDSLLKFAVIISQSNGKGCFANIKKETHALSQISVGGNLFVLLVCKVIIICIAVFISGGICKDNEKKS